MKSVGIITLKTLASGLIFFVGTILGGMVASAEGLPVPAMPDGTDSATLAGGFYMLQAYWFPVGFRMVHCLEMFADSITYIGCLTICFMPKMVTNSTPLSAEEEGRFR